MGVVFESGQLKMHLSFPVSGAPAGKVTTVRSSTNALEFLHLLSRFLGPHQFRHPQGTLPAGANTAESGPPCTPT